MSDAGTDEILVVSALGAAAEYALDPKPSGVV